MAKRLITIITLHFLALLFMTVSYARVEGRPFGAEGGARYISNPPLPNDEKPQPPPYLPSLPQAGEIPPPLINARPATGVGTKKFVRPGVEGFRLDWCAGPGNNLGCGPTAAQLFCQYKGFSRAVSMVEEQGVGLTEPTRRIASNTACTGPDCSGFLSLTCTNRPD